MISANPVARLACNQPVARPQAAAMVHGSVRAIPSPASTPVSGRNVRREPPEPRCPSRCRCHSKTPRYTPTATTPVLPQPRAGTSADSVTAATID